MNKFKTLRQGFSPNVGFITLLTWYKFNLFCLYDINNKQFHRNEANHMWRCFRKHNREYTKQRSICIYFNVKSHVYYKGKVYCLYIKNKFTVLCSLQLTLPASQYFPQFGNKIDKIHKVHRCIGRVVKGSSTLFTLPRLWHAAKSPFYPHHPLATSFEQVLHLLLMDASENQRLVQRPGFQTCKNMTLDRIYQLVCCIKMMSGPALVLHWPACSWATMGSTWRCCVGHWLLPHKRQCPTINWFYRSWPESA